jgi:hypothetical protein
MMTRGPKNLVRARCPFPTPESLPVRVERSCPCERPTRESHVDLRRRPERALRHAASLYVFVTFRDRADSASSPSARATGRESPGFPGALRTSTEPATIPSRSARLPCGNPSDPRRLHDERRGPRPARRRTRVRPLLKGVEHRGCPSSREAPCTLCHRPGCVRGWSCRVRLGDANPERPRSSFAPPPAKEEAFLKTRVLGTAS